MEYISRNSCCPEFTFSATQKNNANFQLTPKSNLYFFQPPKNNSHFEQPQKITICQISNQKNNTSTPVEIF